MKAVRVLLVAGLLLPVLARAEDTLDLNIITRVEVKDGRVEITGNRKPTFTTFTMADPSRLVIDISEAVFKGVPEEIQVGNGVITAIKTASYGSDAAAIARVLIGFEKDPEPDLAIEGETRLVVKVPRSTKGTAAVSARPAQDGGGSSAPGVEARVEEKTKKEAAAEAEKEKKQTEAKAAEEKAATVKAERQRVAAEKELKIAEAKAEKERVAAEAKVERERAAAEAKEAKERAAAEKLEKAAEAKAEKEKAVLALRDKLAGEKAERERRALERQQQAQAAKVEKEESARAEKDRWALEKSERAASAREEQELLKAQKQLASASKDSSPTDKSAPEVEPAAGPNVAAVEAKAATAEKQAAATKLVDDAKASAAAKQSAVKQRADDAKAAAVAKQAAATQQADDAKAAAAAKQAAAAKRADDARAAAAAKQAELADQKKQQQQAREAKAAAAQKAIEDQRQALAEKKQGEPALLAKKPVSIPPRSGTPDQKTPVSPPSGASSHSKTVTLVGFKKTATGSRIFVRTNEPVHYSVSEGDGHSLVLELENTRIGSSNNARVLDTSYFDTPVSTVKPSEGGRSVRVKLDLKQQAPYQARQEGNEVFIEFEQTSKP